METGVADSNKKLIRSIMDKAALDKVILTPSDVAAESGGILDRYQTMHVPCRLFVEQCQVEIAERIVGKEWAREIKKDHRDPVARNKAMLRAAREEKLCRVIDAYDKPYSLSMGEASRELHVSLQYMHDSGLDEIVLDAKSDRFWREKGPEINRLFEKCRVEMEEAAAKNAKQPQLGTT